MRKELLRLENIVHSYDSPQSANRPLPILDQVSLKIEQGASLAITGRSGEGKSTLLHIIGGLEKPTSGNRFWKGTLGIPKPYEIGFVFQQAYLIEESSVWKNMILPLRLQNSSLLAKERAEQIERAREILFRVGLYEQREQIVALLSGGQKQRCAIARALLPSRSGCPKLVLADEPTGNLDHTSSKEIADLLLSLVEEKTIALVLVTHEEALARACEQLYILKKGKLSKIVHG